MDIILTYVECVVLCFTTLYCRKLFLLPSLSFPDVVINLNAMLSLCYLIYELDGYVFISMYVISIAYSSIIKFDYCFMNNPGLTFIVKGWSGGTCFSCKNIWKGNWFYLSLQGLLSSYWTNVFISLFFANALDDEKMTIIVEQRHTTYAYYLTS